MQYLASNKLANSELIDLDEYAFPIFNERLKNQTAPLARAIEFRDKILAADGILIVSPEYNGGYPAALKNAIDLLEEEWKHKPVAIATVSMGNFGGQQAIIQIQYCLWKLGALTAPALFPVPKAGDAFDESGKPKDKEATEKRAAKFLKELLWMIEAKKIMDTNEKKK